jgi:hypothetical protein
VISDNQHTNTRAEKYQSSLGPSSVSYADSFPQGKPRCCIELSINHFSFLQKPNACKRNVEDDVPYKQTFFCGGNHIAHPQNPTALPGASPTAHNVGDDVPYKQTCLRRNYFAIYS